MAKFLHSFTYDVEARVVSYSKPEVRSRDVIVTSLPVQLRQYDTTGAHEVVRG